MTLSYDKLTKLTRMSRKNLFWILVLVCCHKATLLWACSEARHQVEKNSVKRAASIVITGE